MGMLREFDESALSIPDSEAERKLAQETAMSYAVYRLMNHRYGNSLRLIRCLTSELECKRWNLILR